MTDRIATAEAEIHATQGGEPFSGLGELERRAELAWVGENLTLVRCPRSGSGSCTGASARLQWSAWAAYVGGYSSWTGRRSALYARLGCSGPVSSWSCSYKIIPESKQRGYRALLDANEAALREEARARSGDEDRPIDR